MAQQREDPTMQEIITVLKALAGEDKDLFQEVLHELRDILVLEEREGEYRINTQKALRFALMLEIAAEEEKERLPSKAETHRDLLKGGADPKLVNRLFAPPTRPKKPESTPE